jgi:HAE1 family hydrophobic/amphiphilic exporter-1
LSEASQYENLIVRQGNGAPVYLKDIATVKNGLQDERISMRFWYRGHEVPAATVVVAVFRRAGSNAVEVANSIRDLLPTVQAQLPSSVGIVPIYDRSQGIVNSVKDVQATLFVAFALVVLVIFFFLGRARDTLIPVVALPLSLLLTFVVMDILGYSLDNLSLMALTLAIGFLVDDAIVFLENTVRLMESGLVALEASLRSAKEISFTILAMTVSLAAVFLPLVFMGGLVGRIFREFSITIIVSICQRHRFADTYTAHAPACSRTRRARKRTGSSVIGGTEKGCYRFTGVRCGFSRYRWISCDLGGLLLGTVYFSILSQGLPSPSAIVPSPSACSLLRRARRTTKCIPTRCRWRRSSMPTPPWT